MILFIWFSLRVILFTLLWLGLCRYGLRSVRVMDAITGLVFSFMLTIMFTLMVHPVVMAIGSLVLILVAAFVFDVLRDETDFYDRVFWKGRGE